MGIEVADPARKDATRVNEDHHLCIGRQRCSRKVGKIHEDFLAIAKRAQGKRAEHMVVHQDRPCVEQRVQAVKRTSKVIDPNG